MYKEDKINERQAVSTPNRGCVYHRYTFSKTLQGRKEAGRTAYCFVLHLENAYVTAWRNRLWEELSGNRTGKDVENDSKYVGMCEKCCD